MCCQGTAGFLALDFILPALKGKLQGSDRDEADACAGNCPDTAHLTHCLCRRLCTAHSAPPPLLKEREPTGLWQQPAAIHHFP